MTFSILRNLALLILFLGLTCGHAEFVVEQAATSDDGGLELLQLRGQMQAETDLAETELLEMLEEKAAETGDWGWFKKAKTKVKTIWGDFWGKDKKEEAVAEKDFAAEEAAKNKADRLAAEQKAAQEAAKVRAAAEQAEAALKKLKAAEAAAQAAKVAAAAKAEEAAIKAAEHAKNAAAAAAAMKVAAEEATAAAEANQEEQTPEEFCASKCKAAGYACNGGGRKGSDIFNSGSSQMISCAMACMMRAQGSKESELTSAHNGICKRNGQSGCWLTVNKQKYALCGWCAELRNKEPFEPKYRPGSDACDFGASLVA